MSNRNTSDCNYAIRPAWPSPPASRRDCDAVGLTAGVGDPYSTRSSRHLRHAWARVFPGYRFLRM